MLVALVMKKEKPRPGGVRARLGYCIEIMSRIVRLITEAMITAHKAADITRKRL
jgi:hypothetical protein